MKCFFFHCWSVKALSSKLCRHTEAQSGSSVSHWILSKDENLHWAQTCFMAHIGWIHLLLPSNIVVFNVFTSLDPTFFPKAPNSWVVMCLLTFILSEIKVVNIREITHKFTRIDWDILSNLSLNFTRKKRRYSLRLKS